MKCVYSQILRAVLLVLGLSTPAHAAPLAYWRFEQDYTDSSGNGRHAAPLGPHGFTTDRHPLAPGTYSVDNFQAVGAEIRAIRVPNFQGPENGFTAELFFNTTQGGTRFLMGTFDHTFGDGDGTGGWDLHLNNGRVGFETLRESAGSGSVLLSAASYADGAWHHVAATLSATNVMQLYVDGVLQGAMQGQLPAASRNEILFGSSHLFFLDFAYHGLLDEARLSPGVLLPSEFLTAPVPEPSTLTVAGLSILGLLGYGWRRRR